MELRFWNDAETGLPHIDDHGVTEEEVQQVLSRGEKSSLAVIVRGYGSVKRKRGGIYWLFTFPMPAATAPSSSRRMT